MSDLGRIEDLPREYVENLALQNLVPLWPNLRSALPPGIPTRKTQPTCWSYAAMRPLLMESGELTPMEKAERRVLVMANPGHGLESLKASAAIYLGMQLILPGEWAPSHRHTPNAVRMVVEGEGAYTTVAGERCEMFRGDLIITPTGLGHEHEHRGNAPVVWLDVLDLPVILFAEASYAVEGERQSAHWGSSSNEYLRGGVVPTTGFERKTSQHALLRFPWSDVKASLQGIAQNAPGNGVAQVAYVNPETGADVQSNLGFYAMMLQPGQATVLPCRSPAVVIHQIEGEFSAECEGARFHFSNADPAVFPGFTCTTLRNTSSTEPAFLFMADEAPLHRKLGVYECRD